MPPKYINLPLSHFSAHEFMELLATSLAFMEKNPQLLGDHPDLNQLIHLIKEELAHLKTSQEFRNVPCENQKEGFSQIMNNYERFYENLHQLSQQNPKSPHAQLTRFLNDFRLDYVERLRYKHQK